MVYSATFQLGGDIVITEVDGNSVMFLDGATGMVAPIEGLRINRAGVIKEFPDLDNDEDWRKKAIDRFKAHIAKMDTEDNKLNYIITDLVKFGYTPLFKQKAGWRPEKIVMPVRRTGEVELGKPSVS